MDAVSSLLDGPRARRAFLLQVVMAPPFAIRVEDEAPLTLVAATTGELVLVDEDTGLEVWLAPGDVALARGPDHYRIADAPGSEVQVVVHPGQVCTPPDGVEAKVADVLGTRTWGSATEGSGSATEGSGSATEGSGSATEGSGSATEGSGSATEGSGSATVGSGSATEGSGRAADPDGVAMIVGTYERAGEVSRRLLDALPALAVVRDGPTTRPLVALLAGEVVRDEPGQEAVLDRLLDLLLVTAVRAWFARPEAGAPAWYRAHDDPVVGHALRLLHDDPSAPWTVASLAREVGVSRATLARRFADEVGETPIAYLTEWRLALAADLLREPDATVAGVARQVGYGTGFALSAAFSRVRGISPSEHRALAPTEELLDLVPASR
ncbi:helix-turn-helix domain-containing protein [Iamia sp. SCSIO 61187]|uniref:AraC family transcriptional regulator n=1 Tax=Iamia sp. SCSIO 61187 TaxID=2722752 RepID=UPI001C630B2B|nr:AraC family transcriptional regulator [Iamia sp. SCSIO 61187]QYG91042.1 helix-turn-helix domain-containing protein [Iamia sp. SCSIO 61187]